MKFEVGVLSANFELRKRELQTSKSGLSAELVGPGAKFENANLKNANVDIFWKFKVGVLSANFELRKRELQTSKSGLSAELAGPGANFKSANFKNANFNMF